MGRTAELRSILGNSPPGAPELHTRYIATRTYVVLDGESFEVDSMASSEDIARNIRKIKGITEPMSVTGLQSGAFQTALAEMRQKIATTQAQGLAKIEGAVTAGAAELDAAASGVAAKVNNEIADALQEFGLTTNGGPA